MACQVVERLEGVCTSRSVRNLARTLPGASEEILQSDWAMRAKSEHVVAVQAFSGFAPLAILAMIRVPEYSYLLRARV